jgi:hypothetical protein
MGDKGRLFPSGKNNPCPVCGRTKDRDCRTSADGLEVICHHPKDCRPGDVVRGAGDGQEWAFTKNTKDGRAGHFTLDKPRTGGTRRVIEDFNPPAQQQPEPPPMPAAMPTRPPTLARLAEPREPAGSPYTYSDTQRVNRAPLPDGGKQFFCQHLVGDRWIHGAGPDPWYTFNHGDCLESPGWPLEVEGEKCAELAVAAGFVAISQPGHAHSVEQIHQRYEALAMEGTPGVIFLADNDETGRIRAKQAIDAAAMAGLPLLVIHAAELWSDLPEGGSIDDAPGATAEQLALIEGAARLMHSRRSKVERSTAANETAKPTPPSDPAPAPSATKPKTQDAKKQRREKQLSLTRRLACFNRCVEVESRRQRNSLTRRVRLLKAAEALGLSKFINRQEIAQRVLEAKDAQQGHRFEPLTAQQRMAMERPRVQWLIDGLIPAEDMSIVGGRAKVGKTRFALAIADSVLNGTEILDNRPETTRPVVLVTDDQADGDSADMLEALGIWDHPGLLWSRHFRLTESDLDALLKTVQANPGALVILDSLRSIGRSLQAGENDPEIGAILYDLKSAVIEAGGSLLVVHHCNKADGLIGTEALSGHNAIAGSANTIITLHYVPDQNGKPVKDVPQRRIVREARSGQSFDLVISGTAGTGRFHKVGTFAEWQETAKNAADDAKKQQRLSLQQREALEALEDAGQWMTRRQVCEAVSIEWGDRGRGKDARRIDDSLRRLVELGLAESMRAGTESTYRFASDETHRTTRTSRTTSDTSGFDPF